MQELEGRTALVTGGDSGIGLGTARALVQAGMRVVVCGVVEESLQAAHAELSRLGTAEAVQLDVRDRDGFARLADRLDQQHGGVDVLVNNAGVGFLSPTAEVSFDQWDWVLGINLTGVFNGIRTFLPRMLAVGRPAHIVATASIGGLLGAPGSAYAATKFGVVGLMEALAVEVQGTDVGVSVLAPGIVATNIHQGLRPPGEVAEHTPGGASSGDLHVAAMQPDEVGIRVRQAILDEQFYVLTHAEHRELLQRRFDALLAAVPSGTPDVRRAEVERLVLRNPVYDRVLARRTS
ncbi:SDR family oxidoreductase [Kineococcus rhizosphaerae]|uniref:NADP-dependent 3-hydroxy acid dehydrogenase YdfG n=1 Tax=Kineococcus rhizosphaerae TaxID=559628 RepID=A0A2T0RAX0_9ACTN|nr:SDR family oxidoreductase [Kineococcus rhizosphaerae]PRY18299.1 NADP-dependent 3-hydroxy acid dehydrogenase YdfG [Kineococcus rhizosphaerae]